MLTELRSFFRLIWEIIIKMIPAYQLARRKSAEEYRRIALTEYEDNNIFTAIYYYKKAIELEPNEALYYIDLAQIYYQQYEYRQAIECFENAVLCDKSNLRALKGLGFSHQLVGNIQEAMYAYLRYLDIDERDIDVLLNTGLLLYRLGKYSESIEYYQKAKEINPDFTSIYYNIAISYYYDGDYESSITELRSALEIDPTYADALILMGLACEAIGDIETATVSYQQAIESNPDNADARVNLSRLQSEVGKHKEALTNVKQALKIYTELEDKPNMAIAHGNAGWYYYCLGEIDKSIKSSKAALEIDPHLPIERFNLALALLHKGEQDEALNNYQEGIKRLSNLSDLKYQAIDDLEAALERNPKLPGGSKILQFLSDIYNKKYETRIESHAKKA